MTARIAAKDRPASLFGGEVCVAAQPSKTAKRVGSFPTTVHLRGSPPAFPAWQRWLRGILLLGLAILLVQCGQKPVNVPPASQDHAPLITISNFVSGGTGDVDKPSVNSSTSVYVTAGTVMVLLANATNPGGHEPSLLPSRDLGSSFTQ